MPPQWAVSAMTCSSSRRVPWGRRSIWPMVFRRMFLASMLSRSFFRKRTNSFIRAATSAWGRSQFSWLKAYRVR